MDSSSGAGEHAGSSASTSVPTEFTQLEENRARSPAVPWLHRVGGSTVRAALAPVQPAAAGTETASQSEAFTQGSTQGTGAASQAVEPGAVRYHYWNAWDGPRLRVTSISDLLLN